MADDRLEYLFYRFFDKVASPAEKDELMKLLSDADNDEKVKNLMRKTWAGMTDNKEFYNSEQSQDMLQEILTHRAPEIPLEKPVSKKNFFKLSYFAAAASVLLIAGYGLFKFYYANPKTPAFVQNKIDTGKQDHILPGANKAYLTLSNGSVILLDTAKNGRLTREGNTEIVKADGEVFYDKYQLNKDGTIAFNTISTPRGGQYQIGLPDGTKVWLNAASSLRFPVSFTGEYREVYLTGEAFFEVTKKETQPFRVKTKEDMDIEVLGTSFNVMAYDDEDIIKTTLIEGSVKIYKDNGDVNLYPNQQAVLIKNNSSLTLAEGNIEEAIAWKEGRFYFNDEDILSIMRKLSRWYNIDVYYSGKIPRGHYAGTIKRQADISRVLEMLELPGGVKFDIEERKIIVSSK